MKRSMMRFRFKAFALLALLPFSVEGQHENFPNPYPLYLQDFDGIRDAHQRDSGKIGSDMEWTYNHGWWDLIANFPEGKDINHEARVKDNLGSPLAHVDQSQPVQVYPRIGTYEWPPRPRPLPPERKRGIEAKGDFHLIEPSDDMASFGLRLSLVRDVHPVIKATTIIIPIDYSRHPDIKISLTFDLYTTKVAPVEVRFLLEPPRLRGPRTDPQNTWGPVWTAFNGSVTNVLANTWQKHSIEFYAFGESESDRQTLSAHGGFSIDSMQFQITSDDWGLEQGNAFRLDNIGAAVAIPPFRKGDVNKDRKVNIHDLVRLNELIIYDALEPVPSDPPENAEELGLPTEGWYQWPGDDSSGWCCDGSADPYFARRYPLANMNDDGVLDAADRDMLIDRIFDE